MKHLKILAASVIGVAAVGGGVAAAATSGSPSHSGTTAGAVTPATVNVATATVNGKTEQILVDGKGLPLYTFSGDGPTTSAVNGELAALWPPLDSAAPSESGTAGRLAVLNTPNGAQVQYNGHFLYTFISDSPDHVTGQGVQNFSVATPSDAGSAVPVTPVAPASSGSSSSHNLGY